MKTGRSLRELFCFPGFVAMATLKGVFGDPGMEDALYDMPALRQFARLSSLSSIPDETTILNFRH